MAAVRDWGAELVNHPPCSPDLAPSIFCSASWIQRRLAGKLYQNDDEVISAKIRMPQESYSYTTGIQALQHRWKKRIDHRGDNPGEVQYRPRTTFQCEYLWIFVNICEYLWIFVNICEYSKILQDIMEYPRSLSFHFILEYSRIYQNVTKYSKVFKYI